MRGSLVDAGESAREVREELCLDLAFESMREACVPIDG
jgi:hypothetical protein